MVVLYKRNGRMLFTEYERKTKLGCFKKNVLVSTNINSQEADKYFEELKSEINRQEGRDLNTRRVDRRFLYGKNKFYGLQKFKQFNI